MKKPSGKKFRQRPSSCKNQRFFSIGKNWLLGEGKEALRAARGEKLYKKNFLGLAEKSFAFHFFQAKSTIKQTVLLGLVCYELSWKLVLKPASQKKELWHENQRTKLCFGVCLWNFQDLQLKGGLFLNFIIHFHQCGHQFPFFTW